MDAYYRRSKDFIYNALPMIVAIMVTGFMDIQNSVNNPLSEILDKMIESRQIRLIVSRSMWALIQIIPAFLFGLMSDHHRRIKILILSHMLGIFTISMLYGFGSPGWAFLVVGCTFNPFSICRATLLDNYPQISAIAIVSTTFIAKNIFWVFLDFFPKGFSINVLFILISALLVNVIILFKKTKDRYEDAEERKKIDDQSRDNLIGRNKFPLTFSIVGLIFAETSFYVFWIFLESFNHSIESWLKVTTFGALLGVLIPVFFMKGKKIKDLKNSIPVLYLIISILGFFCILVFIRNGIPFQMNHTGIISVVGGIYLILSSEYLIAAAGSERKAIGSVFSELSDMIALFFAPIIIFFIGTVQMNMFVLFVVAFALSATFQFFSERKVVLP